MKNKWTVIYSIDSLKQHQTVFAASRAEAIQKVMRGQMHLINVLDAFVNSSTS